jgi:hypothetical protein
VSSPDNRDGSAQPDDPGSAEQNGRCNASEPVQSFIIATSGSNLVLPAELSEDRLAALSGDTSAALFEHPLPPTGNRRLLRSSDLPTLSADREAHR